MESGLWTVDSERSRVHSGKWTVDSGQWTVDSGQWTSSRLGPDGCAEVGLSPFWVNPRHEQRELLPPLSLLVVEEEDEEGLMCYSFIGHSNSRFSQLF